jgi:hypothetical protein
LVMKINLALVTVLILIFSIMPSVYAHTPYYMKVSHSSIYRTKTK